MEILLGHYRGAKHSKPLVETDYNIMTHKLGQIEKVGSNEQNSIDRTFLIHSFFLY